MKPTPKKTRSSGKKRTRILEGSSVADETAAKASLLTVGHSNRPIEDFLGLLEAHGVNCIVDVRTIPRSRHNPQFNSDAIKESLRRADIRYVHRKQLGGLRHAAKDSINTGWRNASFRGFADYMQTPEFDEALTELIAFAKGKRCAIMCAEAVPWRCHRSLIADALTVRGISVAHIMSRTKLQPHSLTPFSRVREKKLTYPESDQTRLFEE
jgi:uncharacterized protein (DUF488 family)